MGRLTGVLGSEPTAVPADSKDPVGTGGSLAGCNAGVASTSAAGVSRSGNFSNSFP